jgi:hypothetical protein
MKIDQHVQAIPSTVLTQAQTKVPGTETKTVTKTVKKEVPVS